MREQLAPFADRYTVAHKVRDDFLSPFQREHEVDGRTYEVDGMLPVEIVRRGLPGEDIWAVYCLGRCLTAKGKWEYESLPSSRTDAFKKRARFTLEEAYRLCVEHGVTDEAWLA